MAAGVGGGGGIWGSSCCAQHALCAACCSSWGHSGFMLCAGGAVCPHAVAEGLDEALHPDTQGMSWDERCGCAVPPQCPLWVLGRQHGAHSVPR